MAKAKTRSQILEEAKDNVQYQRVALFALAFITLGAVFYHYVERFSWLDSFYFTTMTLATVGYGDLAPKTDLGKLFTILYVFIGITIFIVLARIVLAHIYLRRNSKL